MGIKGLLGYLRSSHHSKLETPIAPDSTLVIDAVGFAGYILGKLGNQYDSYSLNKGIDIPFYFAFKYMDFHMLMKKELELLQIKYKFKIVVMFDGKDHQYKSMTLVSRRAQLNQNWNNLYHYCEMFHKDPVRANRYQNNEYPWPGLIVQQTEATCNMMNVEIIQSEGEADQDIAIYCQANGPNCYCYSGDSDFAVMKDCSFIEFGTLKLIQIPNLYELNDGDGLNTNVVDRVEPDFHSHATHTNINNENNKSHMERVYSRRIIASEILGLPHESLFVELCILLGNDFTSPLNSKKLLVEGFPYLKQHPFPVVSDNRNKVYHLKALAAWVTKAYEMVNSNRQHPKMSAMLDTNTGYYTILCCKNRSIQDLIRYSRDFYELVPNLLVSYPVDPPSKYKYPLQLNEEECSAVESYVKVTEEKYGRPLTAETVGSKAFCFIRNFWCSNSSSDLGSNSESPLKATATLYRYRMKQAYEAIYGPRLLAQIAESSAFPSVTVLHLVALLMMIQEGYWQSESSPLVEVVNIKDLDLLIQSALACGKRTVPEWRDVVAMLGFEQLITLLEKTLKQRSGTKSGNAAMNKVKVNNLAQSQFYLFVAYLKENPESYGHIVAQITQPDGVLTSGMHSGPLGSLDDVLGGSESLGAMDPDLNTVGIHEDISSTISRLDSLSLNREDLIVNSVGLETAEIRMTDSPLSSAFGTPNKKRTTPNQRRSGGAKERRRITKAAQRAAGAIDAPIQKSVSGPNTPSSLPVSAITTPIQESVSGPTTPSSLPVSAITTPIQESVSGSTTPTLLPMSSSKKLSKMGKAQLTPSSVIKNSKGLASQGAQGGGTGANSKVKGNNMDNNSNPRETVEPTSEGNQRHPVLPIDEHKDRILNQIRSNRVTIIHGETGCGKSSRLPVMIYNDAKSRGAPCRMMISQPRRIAAAALLQRLKPELGDAVGMRMGHDTRDETADTRVWFVTTGYLVRYLAHHPENFTSHTHLIVDEVHERSVDGELLCYLCKKLLDVHPHIRIILMSATVHISLYQEYFQEFAGGDYDAGGDSTINCLSVGVKRFPVTVKYLKDMSSNSQSVSTKLSTAVRECTMHIDKALSSGINRVSQLLKSQCRLTVALIEEYKSNFIGKAVLCFVSGYSDIEEMMNVMTKEWSHAYISVNNAAEGEIDENQERFDQCGSLSRPVFKIIPLYSELSDEDQELAFKPANASKFEIKIVIATNIAESSITLPDVDTVICLGTHKSMEYSTTNHSAMLVKQWITKDSATQRAGRTGRVRPGTVYRLYTEELYRSRCPDHGLSEFHSTPLQDIILSLRNMLEDSPDFDGCLPVLASLPEPPCTANIEASLSVLHEKGMISDVDDAVAQLTVLGAFTGQLGLGISLSIMIFYGVVLGVAAECIVLAAALSLTKSPYRQAIPIVHTNPEEYNEITHTIYQSQCKYDNGMYSQPLMMLNLYVDWCRVSRMKGPLAGNALFQWIQQNGLVINRMRQFEAVAASVARRVSAVLKLGKATSVKENQASESVELIRGFVMPSLSTGVKSQPPSKLSEARPSRYMLCGPVLNRLRMILAWSSQKEHLFLVKSMKIPPVSIRGGDDNDTQHVALSNSDSKLSDGIEKEHVIPFTIYEKDVDQRNPLLLLCINQLDSVFPSHPKSHNKSYCGKHVVDPLREINRVGIRTKSSFVYTANLGKARMEGHYCYPIGILKDTSDPSANGSADNGHVSNSSMSKLPVIMANELLRMSDTIRKAGDDSNAIPVELVICVSERVHIPQHSAVGTNSQLEDLMREMTAYMYFFETNSTINNISKKKLKKGKAAWVDIKNSIGDTRIATNIEMLQNEVKSCLAYIKDWEKQLTKSQKAILENVKSICKVYESESESGSGSIPSDLNKKTRNMLIALKNPTSASGCESKPSFVVKLMSLLLEEVEEDNKLCERSTFITPVEQLHLQGDASDLFRLYDCASSSGASPYKSEYQYFVINDVREQLYRRLKHVLQLGFFEGFPCTTNEHGCCDFAVLDMDIAAAPRPVVTGSGDSVEAKSVPVTLRVNTCTTSNLMEISDSLPFSEADSGDTWNHWKSRPVQSNKSFLLTVLMSPNFEVNDYTLHAVGNKRHKSLLAGEPCKDLMEKLFYVHKPYFPIRLHGGYDIPGGQRSPGTTVYYEQSLVIKELGLTREMLKSTEERLLSGDDCVAVRLLRAYMSGYNRAKHLLVPAENTIEGTENSIVNAAVPGSAKWIAHHQHKEQTQNAVVGNDASNSPRKPPIVFSPQLPCPEWRYVSSALKGIRKTLLPRHSVISSMGFYKECNQRQECYGVSHASLVVGADASVLAIDHATILPLGQLWLNVAITSSSMNVFEETEEAKSYGFDEDSDDCFLEFSCSESESEYGCDSCDQNMTSQLVSDRSRPLPEGQLLRYARYVGKRMVSIGYNVIKKTSNLCSNSHTLSADPELITIVDSILYTNITRLNNDDGTSSRDYDDVDGLW